GKYLGTGGSQVVAAGDTVFAYDSSDLRALDLKDAELKAPRWKIATTGTLNLPGVTAMIKAGQHLYVGKPGSIAALSLPLPTEFQASTGPTWEYKIDGTPLSLVAADDRLFVSTREGRIYCFGNGSGVAKQPPASLPAVQDDLAALSFPAAHVLQKTRVSE